MFSKKDCKLSLRLEEEIHKPLTELSERFGVSTAFIARRFIKAGLQAQSKHRIILSANVRQEAS